MNELEASFFVEVNYGFGVGAGPVLVTSLDQSRFQARMVIDFTVECDPNAAVLVGHGVVTGR
jgi:hypothetical protein